MSHYGLLVDFEAITLSVMPSGRAARHGNRVKWNGSSGD
jgi:hypothetical protein